MFSLNVLPRSAAPDATVPMAKTPPKKGQRLSRAELSALCGRMLDVAADGAGPDAMRAAGRVLGGWLTARREKLDGGAFYQHGRRLAKWLLCGGRGKAPFTVFARGNGKLPFYTWSTLPVFTCPGAGECAKWCYSFHGWRNAEPFYRQLQNTLLLRLAPDAVREAFDRLPDGVTVRLYVDGDVASLEEVAFWMDALRARPDLLAYGYSKSWDLLLAYHRAGGVWASNYSLNLSSGGQSYATQAEMERLPIHRGAFVVQADVRLPKGEGRYQDVNYRAQLRDAARAAGLTKYFPCPGECGACTPVGPACASKTFLGMPVIIGAH